MGDEVTKYELWEPQSVYNDVWWRDKVFLENVLRERPAAWLPSGFASYDELLMASADEAVAALQKHTGSNDVGRVELGAPSSARYDSSAGPFGTAPRLLSIGPYPQSGTVDTVRAMGVGHGPAMRFVADLSNFDQSLMEDSHRRIRPSTAAPIIATSSRNGLQGVESLPHSAQPPKRVSVFTA